MDVAKTVKTFRYWVSVLLSAGTGSAPRISTPCSESFVQKGDFFSWNGSSCLTSAVRPSLTDALSMSRIVSVPADLSFSLVVADILRCEGLDKGNHLLLLRER